MPEKCCGGYQMAPCRANLVAGRSLARLLSALVLGRGSLLVVVLAMTAGCATPPALPGEPVTIDLVEMFRVSDAGPRTTEVSLTAPENPHQLLWGWTAPVTAPD